MTCSFDDQGVRVRVKFDRRGSEMDITKLGFDGEAMLAGLPCVATDSGDSARILGSEEFVSVPGDPSTMAEKIHRLLMLDESARLSLGKGNKSLVVDRYSIKKTLAQYQSFYQAAIFEMPAS